MRGFDTKSTKLGRGIGVAMPLPTWPRPPGPSAGKVLPNGAATFVNEMRPPYELGPLKPNPGRGPEERGR